VHGRSSVVIEIDALHFWVLLGQLPRASKGQTLQKSCESSKVMVEESYPAPYPFL
jgi:hypothetical protein